MEKLNTLNTVFDNGGLRNLEPSGKLSSLEIVNITKR